MKKLSFHPCGNYRETYAEELAIFDTWFGRISLIVFLVLCSASRLCSRAPICFMC